MNRNKNNKQETEKKEIQISEEKRKEIPPEQEAGKAERGKNIPIVGIGASAGGLEAMEILLAHMPSDAGIALVIIQHLDPKRKSLMSDLLRRYTLMNVVETTEGMEVEPNTIYLNPPDRYVGIFHGRFRLIEPALQDRAIKLPIDYFFRSLAEDQGEKAICIVLSGSGSDGTLGLKAIKAAGGLTIVQSAEQAQYGAMPLSAISTGMVDYVLPVEKIPREIIGYLKHPYLGGTAEITAGEMFMNSLGKIFMLVRSRTGHDFSNYKLNTIRRRIERRMAVHKILEIQNYVKYLQDNPAEIKALFKDLVISVTNFFRDSDAFETLRREVIDKLLARKTPGSTIRVWVPGCATGEEAFSIAIVIQEAMEELKLSLNVQIFATDIDTDSIDQARSGLYPESIAADISPNRLEQFFTKEDGSYRVKKNIREMVVFAVQNVISDPPFSKLDLVSCRNLLIYLSPTLQKKLVPLFHYTLNPGGYLFLGPSESIGEFLNLFAPINSKWKIFQKKEAVFKQYPPEQLLIPQLPEEIPQEAVVGLVPKEASIREVAERILLSEYSPPCVFVDEHFEVVYFHGPTDRYLNQPGGEPTLNILRMARETLRIALTNALQMALADKKPVHVEDVRVRQNDGSYKILTLLVRPVGFPVSKRQLLMIVFEEKTTVARSQKKGTRKSTAGDGNTLVESLKQELQSTKEYLQTTIEELEASNEELKSSNEELQSTNEELQSTNEELETSKEELQSTNEELVTVNNELQNKIEELARANTDMNNLLSSTEIGTMFLDTDLRIKRFTPATVRIFNVIPADIGRPIGDITAKVEQPNLAECARSVLETLQLKQIEVQAQDGSWFKVRIFPYRSAGNLIEGVLFTFFEISEYKHLEGKIRAAQTYAESVIDAVREPLVVLDSELKVVSATKSFYKDFKTLPEETVGKRLYDLGKHQWDVPELRTLLEEIIPENKSFDNFELRHDFPGIGFKVLLLNARMIAAAGNRPELILLAMEDITDKVQRKTGK